MTHLDILRAAREKISDPARWTQGELARSKKGNAVLPHSSRAVCWCSIGALKAVAGDDEALDRLRAQFALHRAVAAMGHDDSGPVELNDAADHASVLAMFDTAIELEEAAR